MLHKDISEKTSVMSEIVIFSESTMDELEWLIFIIGVSEEQ